jgi:predicted Zn-dependent protease
VTDHSSDVFAPKTRPARLAHGCAAVLLFVATATVAAQAPQPTPSADEQKAREAFAAGKFDDALKLLQSVAKTNPAGMPPKVTLSRWFLEAKKGREARILLEQAAAEDPAHPDVLLTNALYAINEGRLTDAILSCEAALNAAGFERWNVDTRKRFQREARLGLVAALERRGQFAAVKEHLAALLKDDPKNPKLRVSLAQANFVLGNPDEALADLHAARKDDPTREPPELTMGQWWARKADFTKAEDWFQKAAQANPASALVHRVYAGYLLDRGKPELAKGHLAAAEKSEPNARDTKALVGLMARYNKDMATATKLFEELVREYPADGFATANLALVLAESVDANQKRRAVELAKVFASQNPQSAEAAAIYGYCLYRGGQLAEAEQALALAASAGQATLDTAYFLACVLNEKGKVEDAHKLLKEALAGQGAFVYRKDAEKLFAELEKKLPKK